MWDNHYRTERCAFYICVLKYELWVEDLGTSTPVISDTKDVYLDVVMEHLLRFVDLVLVEGLREQVCEVLTEVIEMKTKCPTLIVVRVELQDGFGLS